MHQFQLSDSGVVNFQPEWEIMSISGRERRRSRCKKLPEHERIGSINGDENNRKFHKIRGQGK